MNPVVIMDQLYPSEGGCSERVSLVFALVSAPAEKAVLGCPEENEEVLRVTMPTPEFLAMRNTREMCSMTANLAAYWLEANHRRVLEEFSPWKTLTTQLAAKKSDEEILQTSRQFARAYVHRPWAIKVHGADPLEVLPGLLLEHNRLDLAAGIRDGLIDAANKCKWPSSGWRDAPTIFSESLSAQLIGAAADIYGHNKAHQKRALRWFETADHEMVGLCLEHFVKSGQVASNCMYVAFPEAMAGIIKVAKAESMLETWLAKARSSLAYNIAHPESGYSDGDIWRSDPGHNVRSAQQHLDALEKIQAGLVGKRGVPIAKRDSAAKP
jgi:hypothetical protein